MEMKREMQRDVFEAVIKRLKEVGFKGRISYHRYGEPLLRKDLPELVDHVKRHLPKATQILFTNGILLDDRRYDSLTKAGIDAFIVTLHKSITLPKRSRQYVRTPNELVLTNRGGELSRLKTPLTQACFVPSEMAFFAFDGTVLFCYEDVRRRHRMGNILQQSLKEIWYSSEYRRLRTCLASGDRSNASIICRVCDNADHVVAGSSDGITITSLQRGATESFPCGHV